VYTSTEKTDSHITKKQITVKTDSYIRKKQISAFWILLMKL